jgi:hypothetical protein
MIITPDHPQFWETLHSSQNFCPNWNQGFSGYFGIRNDSLLLEPIPENEVQEYLYGGEYEEVDNYMDQNYDYDP